jgi:hypothetical protein
MEMTIDTHAALTRSSVAIDKFCVHTGRSLSQLGWPEDKVKNYLNKRSTLSEQEKQWVLSGYNQA